MDAIQATISKANAMVLADARLTRDLNDICDTQVRARTHAIDAREALTALALAAPGVSGFNAAVDSVAAFETQVLEALRQKDTCKREEREHLRVSLKDLEPVIAFLHKNIQKRTCPVCFDAEVDVVLVPCGHTLCNVCAAQLGEHCFMCKQLVQSLYKIYYST